MKNKVMFLSLFLTGIAFSILAQEKTPRTLRFISDFSSPAEGI
jgi:hypothetical protein